MGRSEEPWTLDDLARLPISDQARAVWSHALKAAQDIGAQAITKDHLWWAIMRDPKGREILDLMNATDKAAKSVRRLELTLAEKSREAAKLPTVLTPDVSEVWERAYKQSIAPWVSLPQLIAALAEQPSLRMIDPRPRPDPELWGDEPSPHSVEEAEQLNDMLLRKRLKRFRHGSLGLKRAARFLTVVTGTYWHQKDVFSLIESRKAVAIREGGGRWLMPAWQFKETGVLPGLADLQEAFPGDAVALTAWVTRPSVEFSGRTPRDMLDAGEVNVVVNLAHSLMGAAW